MRAFIARSLVRDRRRSEPRICDRSSPGRHLERSATVPPPHAVERAAICRRISSSSVRAFLAVHRPAPPHGRQLRGDSRLIMWTLAWMRMRCCAGALPSSTRTCSTTEPQALTWAEHPWSSPVRASRVCGPATRYLSYWKIVWLLRFSAERVGDVGARLQITRDHVAAFRGRPSTGSVSLSDAPWPRPLATAVDLALPLCRWRSSDGLNARRSLARSYAGRPVCFSRRSPDGTWRPGDPPLDGDDPFSAAGGQFRFGICSPAPSSRLLRRRHCSGSPDPTPGFQPARQARRQRMQPIWRPISFRPKTPGSVPWLLRWGSHRAGFGVSRRCTSASSRSRWR